MYIIFQWLHELLNVKDISLFKPLLTTYLIPLNQNLKMASNKSKHVAVINH
jgi:hypothetical protein